MQHVATFCFTIVFASSVEVQFWRDLLHCFPQHRRFLEGISHLVAMSDTQFQNQLGVHADISGHLNKLNLGQQKLLCNVCEAVNGLIRKSSLFKVRQAVEMF